MPRSARPDSAARRKLEALNVITSKLDTLSTTSVLRVLSWARAADVGTAGDELAAMTTILKQLSNIHHKDELGSILRWLDDHYLADDADPLEYLSEQAVAPQVQPRGSDLPGLSLYGDEPNPL